MATYVLPQVLVFQEFQLAAEVASQPLNAFIFGGHAYLARYSDASEKLLSSLGQYDSEGELIDGDYKTCYSWPSKPVGSVIDTTYTKLYIDNALLRYYTNSSGSIARVASNKIKLVHAAIDNPEDETTYPKDAAFYDRGVKVGDYIKVSGNPSGGGGTDHLYTFVKGFEAEAVAADVADAVEYAANHATQVLSAAVVEGAGISGTSDVTASSAASYNGHPTGDIDEVYTIEVTQASTGDDATTAILRVRSASGRDDVVEVVPEAFGTPTAIGARGLTVTWDSDATAYTLGDTWIVTVHQAYTKPTTATGGTYTGTTDRDYIVEVTSGGLFAASPKITVTTTDGTDFSGPTTVPSSGSAVAVGTKGVTITFTGSALHKGSRYLISATAASNGSYKTLILGHNMTDNMDEAFEVELYIKKNLELGEKHSAVPGQYNWSQSNTEFCVFGGIQAYSDDYTDAGVPVALDVISTSGWDSANKLYVQYRAWRSTLSSSVYGIRDVADLDTQISGALTPDNELKWGVYKALQNSNGQEVKYTAVADPSDSSAWVSALDLVEERTDVYGFVPLSRDAVVLGLVQAHINAQSSEVAGRWRVAWFNTKVDTNINIISDLTSEDGNPVLATTEDDPDTSGTQYTRLAVPANNALFETSGVRAGDIVRFQYEADSWGVVTYNEYVVDSVINESTLLLTTGTSVAETVPLKCEVWRTLNLQQHAEAVAAACGNWANTRIRAVWPDTFEGDGVTQEGYFLCAALAGLSGGVVPQQGLTNLEISGVTGVPRTTSLFNRSQLDTIAVNGGWIVAQDPKSGEIYSRHAVTTADYEDINAREEMVVRNVDSISYYFQDTFAPYIGISNVTPSMLDIIEAETNAAIQYLRTANFTVRLGGQLIDASITDLRISAVFKDRITLSLSCNIPYALNNLEVHLLV